MTKRLSKIERVSRKTVRKWERIKVLLEEGEYSQAENRIQDDKNCGFCNEYHQQDLSSNCGYSCTSCPLYKLRRRRCYYWKEWVSAERNGNITSWLRVADVIIDASNEVAANAERKEQNA